MLGAFKPEKEIISYPPTFWPETFTLENFLIVGNRIKIWRYMLNSFIYAFGTTAFAAFVNSLNLATQGFRIHRACRWIRNTARRAAALRTFRKVF